MNVKCPTLSRYGRFCSFSSKVDTAKLLEIFYSITLKYSTCILRTPETRFLNQMYLEKKFHKYSVVIFDLLINNRFLKNQECVFINFDL